MPSTTDATNTADATNAIETQEPTDSTDGQAELMNDLINDEEFDRIICDTRSIGSDMSSTLSTGRKTPTTKKRKPDETSEILRDFLANRPNPSDFIPKKTDDDIQHFLDSMAVTMRRLSPLAVARIKVKMANIVGEEEIAWAQQNPVEYIYLDPNPTNC